MPSHYLTPGGYSSYNNNTYGTPQGTSNSGFYDPFQQFGQGVARGHGLGQAQDWSNQQLMNLPDPNATPRGIAQWLGMSPPTGPPRGGGPSGQTPQQQQAYQAGRDASGARGQGLFGSQPIDLGSSRITPQQRGQFISAYQNSMNPQQPQQPMRLGDSNAFDPTNPLNANRRIQQNQLAANQQPQQGRYGGGSLQPGQVIPQEFPQAGMGQQYGQQYGMGQQQYGPYGGQQGIMGQQFSPQQMQQYQAANQQRYQMPQPQALNSYQTLGQPQQQSLGTQKVMAQQQPYGGYQGNNPLVQQALAQYQQEGQQRSRRANRPGYAPIPQIFSDRNAKYDIKELR